MRVNVEDSVKRHLPRLAKEMGWSVREALGALVLVYNATQQAGIVADTSARIATVCVLDFDDDAQCERFITAMIAAQLAVVLDDGRVRIRGNADRIAELNAWYAQKVDAGRRGGKETQRRRKSSMVSEATSSESQANLKRNQAVLSPLSFVLSPNTNTGPRPQQVGENPLPQQVGEKVSVPKKRGLRANGTNPRAVAAKAKAAALEAKAREHEAAKAASIAAAERGE